MFVDDDGVDRRCHLSSSELENYQWQWVWTGESQMNGTIESESNHLMYPNPDRLEDDDEYYDDEDYDDDDYDDDDYFYDDDDD